MKPQFRKYLVKNVTEKGAVYYSELELAEGSLQALQEDEKPRTPVLVHPEPLDPKVITDNKALHIWMTEIAAKNGGIFPAPSQKRKPTLLQQVKGWFR